MLQKLHIQNYAIIDELEIRFSAGLNIITGETGAGKSILMGALGLILGDRADATVLLQKDRKSIVEGVFKIPRTDTIKQLFHENEWDLDDEIMLRREIAVNGKSRAFVNDTPATLVQLKQLCSGLVDLHQQFDTMELGENAFQQQVLDAMAGSSKEFQEYQHHFNDLQKAERASRELKDQQAASQKELDYHQYLFNELNEAGFQNNELEDLDRELALLSNAEQIKQQLESISYTLTDGEQPLSSQVKLLANKLLGLQHLQKDMAGLSERLQGVYTELKDIAGDLQHINQTLSLDPKRLQRVNDRIALGYKLLKKHNVQHTFELLAIQQDLDKKLQAVTSLEEAIGRAEKERERLVEICLAGAKALSVKRKKIIPVFEEKLNTLLARVGMPNARVRIQLAAQELSGSGLDAIHFLFDANKKDRFEPLEKVASGGERSRLMLCIKNLVAQKLSMPTLIFDEIDTGISGEAARQVGILMKELSSAHQLISITHQPQIAAKAQTHFLIYKTIQNDSVQTAVKELDDDERITVIARMMSGEKPTAAAIENARELIRN